MVSLVEVLHGETTCHNAQDLETLHRELAAISADNAQLRSGLHSVTGTVLPFTCLDLLMGCCKKNTQPE